jgi:hypothetical protein
VSAMVAHAPSNVKDAAAGKSFIFINIDARSAVMGTLMRAGRVGRTPWSAADAHVGLLSNRESLGVRVQGDPRGPGGPPHSSVNAARRNACGKG